MVKQEPSQRSMADISHTPRVAAKSVSASKKNTTPRLRQRPRIAGLWKHPAFVGICSATVTLLIVLSVVSVHRNHRSQSQLQKVLADVGKIMYLPADETPTLATVTDQSKLQGSLKSIAKTGDDVLIYQKHSEAIVYRPSAHKIVAVEPILLGKQPDAALTASVAVLNGSGNPAAMQQFISNLYKIYPNVTLAYKTTAPREFPTTILFAQQLNDPLANEVAQSLGIQAGQVPLGVSDSLAQLTFIIGKDYQN